MQNRFDEFFRFFRTTTLWLDMVNTRENSPWHREENTGRHTEMLLEWYKDNLFNSRTDYQRMMTMIACAFHDVGKPPAQVVKESPEKGVYRSYAGHEGISARLWIDFAMSNSFLVEDVLRMSLDDIHNVAFMIEHHLPYGMKNKLKRERLKKSFMERMGESGHRAFLDLLLCDQHGRVGDKQADNEKAVDEWIKEWETV